MFSAVSSQEHEPGPFTAFHDRVRRLLADLEADREDLELAITDGAARRMLLSADREGEPAADHRLRAEADELDRLIGDLRSALDANRGSRD
jgi:hypothetical protein